MPRHELAASSEGRLYHQAEPCKSFPPERIEEVFEAFWSTKGQRGTGLGLAVTRKIVEEHGGRITLESLPGKGATFVICLSTDRSSRGSADTKLPEPRPAPGLDEDF